MACGVEGALSRDVEGDEYLWGGIHSNTIEFFFSSAKRDLNGIYHNVSLVHLRSYMAEFEFRHNNKGLENGERTVLAIEALEGKRLIYKDPIQ